jgi:ParB family chromosome partitioning protein
VNRGKSMPPRLGKGLSALLSDLKMDTANAAASGDARRTMISIDLVQPNPSQPRRNFDPEALGELVQSIKSNGVLQPLIIRQNPTAEGYQIVAGERRWRAAQAAGLHEIPVIVRDLTDEEAAQIALIENVQRSDLDPIEEAAAYRDLIEKYGHTQDRLAESIGKSRSHIANSVRLLNLPAPVLHLVSSGALSAGHARALLGLDDPLKVAHRVIRGGLNVRQTEKLVREMNGKSPSRPGPRGEDARRTADRDTQAIEDELSANLRMRVRIQHEPGSERGRLSVDYHKLDDLDLLCRVLAAIPRDFDL